MNLYKPLKPGDEIRVIAPSSAWKKRRASNYDRVTKMFENLGYTVSFGKNITDSQRFDTGTVAARVADLHEAYADKNVKAIFALHGGWSANGLLPHIDWSTLRTNPKPLSGFSDITVLLNAIYAKTGNVGYLGPNYSTLGHQRTLPYTQESLLRVLTGAEPITVTKSARWEKDRRGKLVRTQPWSVLQEGAAAGTLLGGNVGTFYLLQGTEYLPRFDRDIILALEDDDESGKNSAKEFDRRLQSLLQLPGLRSNLKGILIGRFQPGSKVTMPDVAYIVQNLDMSDIPVVAGLDFGHTLPLMTLPIGGTVSISADGNKSSIKLIEY